MRASVIGALVGALIGAVSAGGAFRLALADPASAAEVIVVKINDLVFSPAAVKAKVGDTIAWVNDDFLDHTATADDGSFDLDIPAGQSRRMDVTRTGTLPYICRVHPNMRGSIDVVD